MSREIKFRAWDKVYGRYWEGVHKGYINTVFAFYLGNS